MRPSYSHPHMSTQSPTASPSGVRGEGSRSESARAAGGKGNDPPRAAKDGFEWVWYPEGYWAERPVEQRRGSKGRISQGQIQPVNSPVGRMFKWSSRSSRSTQEGPPWSHESESPLEGSAHSISPFGRTQLSQLMPPKGSPQSPYLSEAAQTAALQRPSALGDHPRARSRASRDTWTTFSPTSASNSELVLPGTKLATDVSGLRHLWGGFHKHKVRPSPIKCGRSCSHSKQPDETTQAPNNVPEDDIHPGRSSQDSPGYFVQKPISQPPKVSSQAELDAETTEPDPTMKSSEELPAEPAQAATSQHQTTNQPQKGLRRWLKIPRTVKDAGPRPKESNGSSGRARCGENKSTTSSGSSVFPFNREGEIQVCNSLAQD